MGTNFYYTIPIKERDKKALREMVNKLPDIDIDDIKDKLEEIEKGHSIHLGKRSYGWQFLWNYHKGELYSASLKSIKKYLEDKGGTIMNEYGQPFTIDEFFDEIKNSLYKDENHCDAYQYHQKYPNEPIYYNIDDHEFQSKDGLRFSKSEEFS